MQIYAIFQNLQKYMDGKLSFSISINTSDSRRGVVVLSFAWKSRDEFHFVLDATLSFAHILARMLAAETARIGQCGGNQGAVGT